MRSKNELTEKVIVDWLSFTVPLAEFKHLERANIRDSSTRYKWKSFPKQNWKNVKDPESKQQVIDDYRAEYSQVCFIRFSQWMTKILGVRVASQRDKGLHGYTNSHQLLAIDNTTELGLVGIGGNNDTVFVQLTGEGCKHVFEKIRPYALHFWLTKVLSVHKLARADLAYDDFDGNYSTDYAERAYFDDAFKNPFGGRNPVIDIRRPQVGSELQGDTVYIGTRKSNIFWRIYNKAMERGLSGEIWYRNEVELKKVTACIFR